MRNIKRIIIHCTATPPYATVESILDYWRNVKGWKNVGYHWLIDTKGVSKNIAKDYEVTNGARGYNSTSIHLSYIGGDKGDTRTDKQKESMAQLVYKYHLKYPEAEIIGHRDLSPDKNGDGVITPDEYIKRCPNFEVSKWLKEIGL